MYDFAVRGTLAGFFPGKDANKTVVKIQPEKGPTDLDRDERPGILSVIVPTSLLKNFPMNALIQVRGKETIRFKDTRGDDGKIRSWPRYSHEAESIELVKTA